MECLSVGERFNCICAYFIGPCLLWYIHLICTNQTILIFLFNSADPVVMEDASFAWGSDGDDPVILRK